MAGKPTSLQTKKNIRAKTTTNSDKERENELGERRHGPQSTVKKEGSLKNETRTAIKTNSKNDGKN